MIGDVFPFIGFSLDVLPSPRLPILTFIHRFTPPVSNTLSQPSYPTLLVTPMHCGDTQLVEDVQQAPLLEDNGIKAREKAVSTEAQ